MNSWIPLVMLSAALLTQAGGSEENFARTGVNEFRAACQAWDGRRFAAAAQWFQRAITNSPNSATNYYWRGVAKFHELLFWQHQPAAPSNTVAATAAMDVALKALQRAVKLDPRPAESHALLSTLYGMKIAGNWLRGLRYGPKVSKHQKQALRWGATNPRVQYLLGTCQFHTAKKPGDFRDALKTLLAAEKLFVAEAQNPTGPLEPRWGFGACLTFIGRTYEALGQRAKAAQYYRQALHRRPADALAREGLARVVKTKE